MRIAIANFTGFRGNWGSQVTSWELLKFLSGAIPEGEPLDLAIVPPPRYSFSDFIRNFSLPSIYQYFEDVVAGNANSAAALATLERICLARYRKVSASVKAADLVVFQGEGSMGGGSDFFDGPLLMLLPFVAKHAWGKTVIGINQSFFSADPMVVRNAVLTFNSFDYVAFREVTSLQFARQSGVRNARLLPDVAFSVAPSGEDLSALLPEGRNYFFVSGSALKKPGRYQQILDAAATIQDRYGLIPVIGLSRDAEMTALVRVRWRDRHFVELPRSISYTTVAQVMQQCAFCLGGRYHMAIVAAAAGTPPLLLKANSFKMEGLRELLDLSLPVRDFDDLEGILSDVAATLTGDVLNRQRLGRAVNAVRRHIDAGRADLARVIRGEPVMPGADEPAGAGDPGALIARYAPFQRPSATRYLRPFFSASQPRLFRREEIIRKLLATRDGDALRTDLLVRQLRHEVAPVIPVIPAAPEKIARHAARGGR